MPIARSETQIGPGILTMILDQPGTRMQRVMRQFCSVGHGDSQQTIGDAISSVAWYRVWHYGLRRNPGWIRTMFRGTYGNSAHTDACFQWRISWLHGTRTIDTSVNSDAPPH
jgi:hypothetical protein